jgi:hypothetical protein
VKVSSSSMTLYARHLSVASLQAHSDLERIIETLRKVSPNHRGEFALLGEYPKATTSSRIDSVQPFDLEVPLRIAYEDSRTERKDLCFQILNGTPASEATLKPMDCRNDQPNCPVLLLASSTVLARYRINVGRSCK